MKTKHRIIPVALLSSLTLITGLVFAADRDYPTNPERSFTTQLTPIFKTRAEVRAELDEFHHTYPTNPERSFTTQLIPTVKTRAEVRAELDEFRHTPVTLDGWQYVGGERGDALIPHNYKFVDGKFVPSDNFGYISGSPSRMLAANEQKQASLDY